MLHRRVGPTLRQGARIALVSVAALALLSCGETEGITDEGPSDTGDGGVFDTDVGDVPPDASPTDARPGPDAPAANSCGGDSGLLWEGVAAGPGDSCGECGDGLLACLSGDELRCADATLTNACGGCDALDETVGAVCGACESGSWVCDGDNAVTCQDDREENACGGCAVLGATPGDACGTGAFPATWSCVSDDEIRCVGDEENACGGTGYIEEAPGDLCGTCGRGTLACDGLNALVCDDEDNGVNECGGCEELAGPPGADCGDCGGVWECSGGVSVCSIERNACGGCGDLEAQPGSECDEGTWVCELGAGVTCTADAVNACGGVDALEDDVGAICGECTDGITTCVDLETTECLGATDLNACGGCGELAGTPGTECATGALFVCLEGEAVCSADLGLNNCGGVGELAGDPGQPCGTCDTGTYRCQGPEAVQCARAADPADYEWWPDTDGDGFGDADEEPEIVCEGPYDGLADNGDDCNDGSEFAYPGAPEDVCATTEDLNCDGFGGPVDGDGDGVDECSDCDDTDDDIYPGNPEVCDGRNNDCDDEVDEDAGPFWYFDFDEDGHGDADSAVQACSRPEGYVAFDDDCDDEEPLSAPGRAEVCDDIDNDCDGTVDGEGALGTRTWWPDFDGDGFGDPILPSVSGCEQPEGYVDNADDCRDDDVAIHPDADEVCDGRDNNCDGVTDLDAIDRVVLYEDVDLDGYGDEFAAVESCPAFGLVEDATDCDDLRDDTYPGAIEIVGDGADQNCDGVEECYVDADNDGFIAGFETTALSESLVCDGRVDCPDGVASTREDGTCWIRGAGLLILDCDESNADIYPGAIDEIGDGIDQNCDNLEICYLDADDDGYRPDEFAIVVSTDGDCSDSGEAVDVTPVGDCFDAGECVAGLGDGSVTVCPGDVYPGATESTAGEDLVGVDYNCDGSTTCFVDDDEDDYRSDTETVVRSAATPTAMCDDADVATVAADDEADVCDADASINPGATEIFYDGLDSNCNGQERCYLDGDDDGYRLADWESVRLSDTVDGFCDGPGYATESEPEGDCNDGRADIHPDADDTPDTEPADADTNCDGRDGVYDSERADRDEYISAGATRGEIQTALDACEAREGCDVLVEVGEYDITSPLDLRAGVGVYGGYDVPDGDDAFVSRHFGFVGDPGWPGSFGISSPDDSTIFRCSNDRLRTLRADDLAASTTIDGLRVIGCDREGSNGRSTVTIALDNSDLEIVRSRIEGGDAEHGNSASAADDGDPGGDGGGDGSDSQRHYGGTSACGATGGNGARRLSIDSFAECTLLGDLNTDGSAGGDTTVVGEAGCTGTKRCGSECNGDRCDDYRGGGGCVGTDGADALCGLGGLRGGASIGSISAGIWSAADYGVASTRGLHGGGGGGDYGRHGGSSFAVIGTGTTLTVTDSTIVIGRGGDGSDGTDGGVGGAGGEPQFGGDGTASAQGSGGAGDGGRGGYGGDGGGGGGGAGGNGGPAVGSGYTGSLTTTNVDYEAGVAGDRGTRGSGGAGTVCSGTQGEHGLAGEHHETFDFDP